MYTNLIFKTVPKLILFYAVFIYIYVPENESTCDHCGADIASHISYTQDITINKNNEGNK